MEYLLLSKISTNNIIYDICIILIVLPILTFIKKYVEDDIPPYIRRIFRNRWTSIGYSGLETIAHAYFSYSVSDPFIALCHYITINNLAKQNYNRNHNKVEYISDGYNINLGNGIYVDIITSPIKTPEDRYTTSIKEITILIKSKKLNFTELKQFVEERRQEYSVFKEKENANKLYHFIYQSEQNGDPIFVKKLLSDTKSDKNKSYETFDTIFSEHKESLKRAITRLHDDEYFKKTGSKRKAGFLFYGKSGCGKTSHVTAIANYDNRHIIEVPMSRIKTNIQLETLLAVTDICGVSFKPSQIIILFDEIDQCSALKPRKIELEESFLDIEEKNNNLGDSISEIMIDNDSIGKKTGKLLSKQDKDALNLGFVLSRFDGIGNYNGIIIIATTNCISSLSPALYRDGRLTSLCFEYCRHEDIVNIIEHRYDIKISADDLLRIPDRSHKITPTKLIKLLDKNIETKMNIFNDIWQ